MNKKFLGSNIALFIGILALVGGLSQASNLISAGVFMILGALAYKSAKKRKLSMVQSSTTRFVIELIAIAIIVFLVLMTGQKYLVEDPFVSIFIPTWAIIAYIVISVKNINKLPVENEQAK